MIGASISDGEFARFQDLIRSIAGINLTAAKKPLLCGRLAKRLRSRSLASYADYYALVSSGREPEELQTCVDLLTTNETYFFREERHFGFLRECAQALRGARALRVWSAACSSGEEPYSIAMVLAETLGEDGAWEVFGSDLSAAVLRAAAAGIYRMERGRLIPRPYLERYCLKGVGSQAGQFRIDPGLRRRVQFAQINLNAPLPALGPFDLIFLRNVMIYFEPAVKRAVVARLAERLAPGGRLLVGHAESLNGITDTLRCEAPTIYRKPA